MEKEFKFAVEDIQKLNIDEYDENEYCVGRMKFLSTRPNSHGLKFSEQVLKRDAPSVLGSWVVAETFAGDFTTHTSGEFIQGIVPKEQTVEFVRAEDGYLDAYVDVVLSKRYSKTAYDVFVKDNDRSVSIEFNYTHPEEDEYLVDSFIIRGTTILGKTVKPSVPNANLTITRFSEEEADKFFAKVHNDSLTVLKKFVEERKNKTDKKEKFVSHPIDTSKDFVYEGEWDGQKAKQDLVKEKNFKSLAPKVCMKLESGWEDREITKLGYPVMTLHDGKWVYSTKGLSSALGYAKKENETEIVNKIEKIYKKLGLNQEKEESAKMSKEIEFAAVDIGDMWGKVFDALHDRYPDGDWGSVYRIDGIYEQDNKKFAIIHRKEEDIKYRLDFSLTEEGLVLADEIVKIEIDIVETEEVKKFAEPEDSDKYKKFEDDSDDEDDDDSEEDEDDNDNDEDDKQEEKMSEEEMKAKIAKLEKSVEERDNIIMEKDTCMEEMKQELAELRQFKESYEKEKMAKIVESVMSEVKDCLSETDYKDFREEGLSCKMSELDGWKNKVKAVSFEVVKNTKNKKNTFWSFSAPAETKSKSNNSWNWK